MVDPFKTLTPEELAKVEPLTREQIEAVLAEGRELAAAMREMRRRQDIGAWHRICEVRVLALELERRIARIEERLGMKP
jgi:hypothetical protein